MRLAIVSVLAIFALGQPLAIAQQAGENINVLPVTVPVDDDNNGIADDPLWYVKGDGFLQRQVEPTIAASTRNPDHLLAFFVDYRAVDIPDDIGLGEGQVQIAALKITRTIMMATLNLSIPQFPRIELPPIAAAEAWVGMSRSYDGGLTWSGGFLPGALFDTSHASQTAPVYGLEAATDPVLAAGPCGKFYLVFMAFTRGGQSMLAVARYQDNNYAGGGDHISYEGMTVVEIGNNATNGHFLDKPDIEVDIFRDSTADVCADRVAVSYSTFTGLASNGSFQSKLHVATSFDGGLSFNQTKINQPYTQNQGTALAVDPADGTLYAFWRHFGDPDAILAIRSANFGKKWTKPIEVTESVPMAAFDQPSISVDDAYGLPTSPENSGFPETAFRSNGFPTAAVAYDSVTGKSTVFVAWQERVDAGGRPDSNGAPRIVLARSEDDGDTWTDVNGHPNRLAVDMGWRDLNPPIPGDGLGKLPQTRLAGSQVQPKLFFSGGQLLLAYYESRGRIAGYESTTPTIVPSDIYTTGFISGYDRLLDFRAALLDPQFGTLASSIQVSRYPIRGDADLSNGEQLVDVAPVDPTCDPNVEACARQANLANLNQSGAGRIPFIGDYPDIAPVQQFVFDGAKWKWATEAVDVPYQGFHVIFTDNRHLLPPPGPYEWEGYQDYDPPWKHLSDPDAVCTNPGSRNTDVLTSKIDTSLVLSAPTTFKDILGHQRSFPFSVQNKTAENRIYYMDIIEGSAGASFHRFDATVDAGDVEIFAHSNGSFLVYIDIGYTHTVRVQVSEVCLPDDYVCTDASGILTFNADSGYDQIPSLDGWDTQFPELADETFFVVTGDIGDPDNPFVFNSTIDNPFVFNPFVFNPFVFNPFVYNSSVDNPFVFNPFVFNPFVFNTSVVNPFVFNPFVFNTAPSGEEIEAIIDTTWTVSPGDSNSASSYMPVVNIDNAQAFIDAGYVFQLIVYKGSLYGGVDGCVGANVIQPQILANVTQDPGAENPFVFNPFVFNPFVFNSAIGDNFVDDPYAVNSSFTMAPAANADAFDDQTTKANPVSTDVKITLRAVKIAPSTKAGELKNGDSLAFEPWVDPPSLVIVPQRCAPGDPEDECKVLTIAPDLTPRNVSTDSLTAPSGGTLPGFPDGGWTLRNEGYGDANAENGSLRHGFYICPVDYIDGYPDDEQLDVGELSPCTPIDEFILNTSINGTDSVPLDPGSYPVGAVDLTMPDLPEGNYSLVLYVDDTLEISEFNEANNWVAVPIFIEEPNEPPVATDTTFDTDEDTTLSAFLPASDPDLDPLTFAITSLPTMGTLTLVDAATGAFTFEPALNSNETVAFDFEVSDDEFIVGATVTITINPVNDPPVMDDIAIDVDEDGIFNDSMNATDVDGDILTYSVTLSQSLGDLQLDAQTGDFTYEPTPDENGTDSFGVAVSDGELTTGAVVTVTIVPVPDAPVAYDGSLTTAEDTEKQGTATGFDADGDPLTFTLASNPSNGTVTFASDGTFTYLPDAEFNGNDSFEFTASDGGLTSGIATIVITVTPVNDPPTAVDAVFDAFENTPRTGTLEGSDIDGDVMTFTVGSDPAHGSVTIATNGDFTYVPGPSFIGPDGFTFVVDDGNGGTDTGTVTITVIDPVPNWDFIGFATPWRPNYKVNAGSAIPLKWYYADPDSGDMVSSFHDDLQITATGYSNCSVDPEGNPTGILITDPPLALPEDAGSSDLRYNGGNWQLNWDTSGLEEGCYFLSIYHPTTNQLDVRNVDGDLLKIQLK